LEPVFRGAPDKEHPRAGQEKCGAVFRQDARGKEGLALCSAPFAASPQHLRLRFACGGLFSRPLDKARPLAARKAPTVFRTSRQNTPTRIARKNSARLSSVTDRKEPARAKKGNLRSAAPNNRKPAAGRPDFHNSDAFGSAGNLEHIMNICLTPCPPAGCDERADEPGPVPRGVRQFAASG
jgi:hypothetical protein